MQLESSSHLKGTLLKTFVLVFPKIFKAAVFLKIAGNIFQTCVDITSRYLNDMSLLQTFSW